MQCSNCQFENMPGIELCGRCGASLRLGAMAIDVYPPRAGRWAKRWRRWMPLRGLQYHVRDTLGEALRSRLGGWAAEQPALAVLVRMVVPGWAQRYCGRRLRGRLFFWGYVATLLLGLVFLGTHLGSLLLGLAVSLHAATILDVVFAARGSLRSQIGDAVLYAAIVGVCLYLPGVWLFSRVVVAQRIVRATEPLAAGDVFLYNPSAYRHAEPQVGDVVYYRISGQQRVRGGYPLPAIYDLRGGWIDRIVGRPGQKVVFADGHVRLDGQLSPWVPLNPDRVALSEVTLPADCYLIVPSAHPLIPTVVQMPASIVQRSNILGRVYLRSQPLWRLWWVR